MALIALAATARAFAAAPTPHWTVDPAIPGADLPSRGRSLFDQLIGNGTVPFPFERLLAQIGERSGCTSTAPCTRAVLIPLGRSLQRTSAAPDYFVSPRVVVAAVDQGAGLAVKNRLYLGYQERANLIEVVSYNEAAARFEFELVRNYASGRTPEVIYANRTVCTACHQNQAPIFSQQVWLETNANREVANLLNASGPARYGIPVRGTLDIANTIDESVARANLLAGTQWLWREGCGATDSCRAALLHAALQYVATNHRGFERTAEYTTAAAQLARSMQALAPAGLAIPEPSIPNRDPLTSAANASALARSHVAAPFEPLLPRAARTVWPADADTLADLTVIGIAGSLSAANADTLDAALATTAQRQPPRERTVPLPCVLDRSGERIDFECTSTSGVLRGSYEGARGTLDAIAIGDVSWTQHYYELKVRRSTAHDASVVLDVVDRSGNRERAARLRNGARIESIQLTNRPAAAVVTVREDFAPVRAAVDRMLARSREVDTLDMSTRYSLVLSELTGVAPVSTPRLTSTARVATPHGTGYRDVPAASALEPYCGACHRTDETTPPNFLAGDAERVRAALTSCAPRILARLAMWDVASHERAKTPMPPATLGDTAPISREALAQLGKHVATLAPAADAAVAYEDLPRCLPVAPARVASVPRPQS
jgi:hypothetical protein